MLRQLMLVLSLFLIVTAFGGMPVWGESPQGYYRYPAIHADTVVFTAEGDLWKVGIEGGIAQRLTTHPSQEIRAAFSPDGGWLAFTAVYEGPAEVYVMPVGGGLPLRLTHEGSNAWVVGWTPKGKVLYTTRHYSTLPNNQLVEVDPKSGERRLIPLSQASHGVYDPNQTTLFFTRLPFQGSFTKRYKGGTVQNLWRFTDGDKEAVPLTSDYPGTSKDPMWWRGRIYFLSDRDGTMNVWSMNEDGKDLRQHTRHVGWDAKSPSLSQGKIAYQLGADIHLLDLASGQDRKLDIRLASDFDQLREKWVKEPMDYLTAVHLSPDGDRVVLTARGQVFVAPVKQGRLVEATRNEGVRYRRARFLPDGKSILVLSDESGELEFWKVSARGVDVPQVLTQGGKILRFDGIPSPDGRWVAYYDKNYELWLVELETRKQTKIDVSAGTDIRDLSWSPDSQWLAYAVAGDNFFLQVKLYNVRTGEKADISGDRFNSYAPAWSPDGKWLAFLSDRNLVSLVRSPWGSYHPGPFLSNQTKVYLLPLRKGLRSPFQEADELFEEKEKEKQKSKEKPEKDDVKKAEGAPEVVIELEGIRNRLVEVPIPPGDYGDLSMNSTHLYYLSRPVRGQASLMALKIGNEGSRPVKVVEGIRGYELSLDRKKILVRKGSDLYVLDASGQAAKDLAKNQVNLEGWSFSLDPREEWRQMFVDAWRLERDYFYDPNMHGVDWSAVLRKYEPLVERVTDRAELNDLVAQMVGELSALHIFVRGGDHRQGNDQIGPAFLGARLVRDEAQGGYRVATFYRTDPDFPDELAPLAQPGVDVNEGDVIVSIDGVPTLTVADPGVLLRNRAGKQVLLGVKNGGNAEPREVIVHPVSATQNRNLRYSAWEYSRRLMVEEWGESQIGYVHLRAMGGRNYTEWARNFFPVFNRKGLIIDVRHNTGGNIDSWILSSLMRKAWMWWRARTGAPYSNMQYAPIGHMVVLVNERTASDGEAFAEGFRRLGLGKIIGTRTWGGEIWLTSSNFLVDRGIATAAEFGVYGPEGEWLIEGHGVDPDIVVDNLPHATFNGEDAQLRAAVAHLQKLIREQPVTIPPPPPYPNKSVQPPR